MEALVIKSDSKKDLNKLKKLIQDMGMESTLLSNEDIEDLGLSILIEEADRNKTVSRDEIMKKLNGK